MSLEIEGIEELLYDSFCFYWEFGDNVRYWDFVCVYVRGEGAMGDISGLE